MLCVLYVEAFSTTTRSLNVGVVEDEALSHSSLFVVHLCSQQGQLCFPVDEYADTCKLTKHDDRHITNQLQQEAEMDAT